MREGVVILPAAERVKLIAGAKQALHHDGIRSCRGHIRRVLAEELEEACRVGRGLGGDIITLLATQSMLNCSLCVLIPLNIHSSVNFVD